MWRHTFERNRTILPLTAASAREAARFLGAAWQPRFAGDPALAAQALALAGLCGWLDQESAPTARRFALRLLDEAGAPVLGSSDLTTALFAAAAVVRLGVSVPQVVLDYLQLLAEIVPAEAAHGNDVAARLALHGSREAGAGARARLRLRVDLPLLRTGESRDARRILDDIEYATRLGTAPCDCEPSLSGLLEGVGMGAFKRYDLPLGMRCLRARAYLDGRSSLGLRMGLDFLRWSQGADGSFGDYDSAFARLAGSNREQAAWNVKAAVTIQALWTMAEIEEGSVRLFSGFFGESGLAQSLTREEDIAC